MKKVNKIRRTFGTAVTWSKSGFSFKDEEKERPNFMKEAIAHLHQSTRNIW